MPVAATFRVTGRPPVTQRDARASVRRSRLSGQRASGSAAAPAAGLRPTEAVRQSGCLPRLAYQPRSPVTDSPQSPARAARGECCFPFGSSGLGGHLARPPQPGPGPAASAGPGPGHARRRGSRGSKPRTRMSGERSLARGSSVRVGPQCPALPVCAAGRLHRRRPLSLTVHTTLAPGLGRGLRASGPRMSVRARARRLTPAPVVPHSGSNRLAT